MSKSNERYGLWGGYHGQFISELKFLDILGFIKDTIEINFTCSSVSVYFFLMTTKKSLKLEMWLTYRITLPPLGHE